MSKTIQYTRSYVMYYIMLYFILGILNNIMTHTVIEIFVSLFIITHKWTTCRIVKTSKKKRKHCKEKKRKQFMASEIWDYVRLCV